MSSDYDSVLDEDELGEEYEDDWDEGRRKRKRGGRAGGRRATRAPPRRAVRVQDSGGLRRSTRQRTQYTYDEFEEEEEEEEGQPRRRYVCKGLVQLRDYVFNESCDTIRSTRARRVSYAAMEGDDEGDDVQEEQHEEEQQHHRVRLRVRRA